MTLVLLFKIVKAKEISCEAINHGEWEDPVGGVKTCRIPTTGIIEPQVTFSGYDESMGALTFDTNPKIYYLPVQVALKFPNLMAYDANSGFIKVVTKQHFRGLTKLKALSLQNNQIEKIPNDTFEDAKALKIIYLGKNK